MDRTQMQKDILNKVNSSNVFVNEVATPGCAVKHVKEEECEESGDK